MRCRRSPRRLEPAAGTRRVAAPQADEIGAARDATSLQVMQAIYRNPTQPISRRMRVAMAALPFEHPKLSVTAALDGSGFAEEMKAIARAMAFGGSTSAETTATDHTFEHDPSGQTRGHAW
jgi:hypothetical protein